MIKKIFSILLVVLFLSIFNFSPNNTEASHSWGGYHWARSVNPLSLKLGNNLTTAWNSFLQTASTDWSLSLFLDTTVVTGQSNPKNCRPTSGRVEVCNSKYGNNGWLGIAQIWASGSHITQGVTKLNDTYFNTKKYNTPAWKQFVVCQEIGHTFGLDHQDENFNNSNMGTCMDYTNDPNGTLTNPDQLSNEHPNGHDYEELEIIYAHLDATNTSFSKIDSSNSSIDLNDPSAWGKSISESSDKRTSLYEKDLGKGNKIFTFVVWAN